MSVFRNLDCLSLVVCSNTTLLKLQNVLFLLFSKFCASKSGVRLIYGCGLYTDVYSNPPHSIKNADRIIRMKHIYENERKIIGRKKPEVKKKKAYYNQIDPLHKWHPNLNNNT